MKIALVLLLSISISFAANETDEDYTDFLSKIFTSSTTTTERIIDSKSKGDCECVPRFQCKDNSLSKFGLHVISIRLGDGPCDYLSVCCKKANIVSKPDPNPVEKPKSCGIRNPDGVGFRIKDNVNNESEFGEFPWMVALLRRHTNDKNNRDFLYQCGASLIHPQAVLTSAHCIEENQSYYVRAGEWDTKTENELFAHQDSEVKTIIIHPEYEPQVVLNDVAILILETPMDIVENVNTVCLPEQGFVADTARCFASGWGKDVFGTKGNYQAILKKVELPIVPSDTCQDRLRSTQLGEYFELHSSFICAGGEKGKDTCTGDGGSPLVCPVPNRPGLYYQAGMVAWGIGCGEDKLPGVYVNVALFRQWIDEQFLNNKLNTTYYTY